MTKTPPRQIDRIHNYRCNTCGKEEAMSEAKRFWDVGGSLPKGAPGNDKSWAQTLVFHVVARDATSAIAAVLAANPGFVVHTLQHRGAIDIVEAP